MELELIRVIIAVLLTLTMGLFALDGMVFEKEIAKQIRSLATAILFGIVIILMGGI